MGRQEFLNELREALTGEIPESEVESNLRYYGQYISSEVQKDRQEKEVLNQLGDPRLIAHTIIDTFKMSGNPWESGFGKEAAHYYDEDVDYSNGGENPHQESKRHVEFYTSFPMPWYKKFILILIFVFIIAAILTISGFAIKLFFTIGLPVLLILILIRIVMQMTRR